MLGDAKLLNMRASCGFVVFALAGCATQSACIKPAPQIVKVPVVQYVPVPVALTAPVPLAKPQDATVVECVRVAIQRAAAIGQCNAQLDKIRELEKQ
jgi:hypothetical protein